MKKQFKTIVGIVLSISVIVQTTVFALEDYRKTNKIDYMDRVFHFDMGEFLEGYEYVEKHDEYFYYINILKELGIYSEQDVQKSSDSKIKQSEAKKIMLNIIFKNSEHSYSDKNIADDEYLSMYDTLSAMCDILGYEKIKEQLGIESIADNKKLLKDVSYNKDKFISFGEFSVILWNTLNANSMKSNFSGDGISYDEEDISFLESHLEITKTVGYLNAANGLNIYKNSPSLTGYVEIDRASFYVGNVNMLDYLGHRVTVYSRKNNIDDDEIIHIEYAGSDDSVTVDFNDIISVGSQIKYNDGKKSYKTLKLSDIDYIMFNGDVKSDISVIGDFENMDGNVTFSKSEKSSVYDIAIINSYEYYVVYSVDEEERRIYLKDNAVFRGENYIDIPDDKYVSCTLDKNKVDYLAYYAGNVIKVLQNSSKTYTQIDGMSKTVTGKITGYDNQTNEAVINNKEYKIAQSYLKRDDVTKIKSGLYGTFYISSDDYIAGYKKAEDAAYGFLKKAVIDEDKEKSYIEVFTQDNEWKTFELKEKITLDGKDNVLAADAIAEIKNHESVNSLIRYKINNSSFVTFIDTLYDDMRENKDDERLVQSYAGNVTMSWKGGRWFRTDMGYRILNDRPVFEIPNNLDRKDEYKVITSSNLNKDESQIYISMYSANSLGLCQVALISQQADNVATDTAYWFYCEKISTVWNDEEATVAYKMDGKRLRNGTEEVVDFSVMVTDNKKENVEYNVPGAIAPGALMRMSYNSDGYLTGADVKFVNATLPEIGKDVISSYFQHLCGVIDEIDVDNEYIKLACGTGTNDMFVMPLICVVAIDKDTKKCRKVQLGDLRVGEKMFVYRAAGDGRICAVVR